MDGDTGVGAGVARFATMIDRKISVAPMMDWTDRHCRYFLRLFSPCVLLYTEMITAQALCRGGRRDLLRFNAREQPVAVQLGGAHAKELAEAAAMAEQAGYIEVNLNCGCPSDRVRSGAFGACLMLEPAQVAEIVAAMRARVSVPVTVKLRIGVVTPERSQDASIAEAMQRFDELDYQMLLEFARGCVAAGASALIVHGRKAVLGGLSPHENRTVPPLYPEVVARLRTQLGAVPVVYNGGVRSAQDAARRTEEFDGVMIGREAYHRPQLLTELHRLIYADEAAELPDEVSILEQMREYCLIETAQGTPLHAMTRHMLGLISGRAGARQYRSLMSQDVQRGRPITEVFEMAKALCLAS